MESQETLPLSGAKTDSNYHMVDVTQKSSTVRVAQARGLIRMSPATFALVRDRKLPKGDALALAEVSGIMAAKQTPNLLPLCHPIPIEKVTIKCIPLEKESSVEVICEVSTTAKTGVEMEALVGTQAALLCLYDLIKMVDPDLNIEGVRLNFKQGGKKGFWKHSEFQREESSAQTIDSVSKEAKFYSSLELAIVIASDRVSRNEAQDLSGPCAQSWFEQRGASVKDIVVVPDDTQKLKQAISKVCESKIPLLILSGGTGMGPRDVTIPTLQELNAKETRGIGELLRQQGGAHKKTAWLSNSGGFILNQTLIIALPGSPKAVQEGLGVLEELLPHALHVLSGGNHG